MSASDKNATARKQRRCIQQPRLLLGRTLVFAAKVVGPFLLTTIIVGLSVAKFSIVFADF